MALAAVRPTAAAWARVEPLSSASTEAAQTSLPSLWRTLPMIPGRSTMTSGIGSRATGISSPHAYRAALIDCIVTIVVHLSIEGL